MGERRALPRYIVAPKPEVERLGSPALYAQRKLMGETGRAEAEREGKRGRKKRAARKRVAGK